MVRIAIAFLLLPHSFGLAEEFKVLTWNVESGRSNRATNDPDVIASQLKKLQSNNGPYDLISLTEVKATSKNAYTTAINAGDIEYFAYLSTSGDSDRLMIFVRKDRFDVVGQGATELKDDGGSGRSRITFPGDGARRPFLVTLKDKENNNLEFKFMVNHLTRGNAKNRQSQARGLREWARRQSMPLVASGDYNFDYDFRNLTGNQAMSIFLRRPANEGGAFVWDWVIPGVEFEVDGDTDGTRKVTVLAELIDTNWYGNESGEDLFRDSILDFIFVGQGARKWGAKSKVLMRSGDFPDDQRTSDHRPVEAILDPAGKAVDVGGPRDK